MNNAAFVFPAVKGIQAQREYYISMVPLEILSKIFQFVDEELPPEIRAQRVLNKSRIPEIKNYILSNPDSYVFSALTVSIDGDMDFQAISDQNPNIGNISIGMTARFLINDGQHRRAAIVEAIKENPSLKNEEISVVFYRDEGLQRSQQMFSDLNRYAIKPTKSINILFNSREESSVIAKAVIENADVVLNPVHTRWGRYGDFLCRIRTFSKKKRYCFSCSQIEEYQLERAKVNPAKNTTQIAMCSKKLVAPILSIDKNGCLIQSYDIR